MIRKKQNDARPEIKRLQGREKEYFGQLARQVFFSPKTTCNKYIKMAYVEAQPGSTGTPHIHLGEEIAYTIKGRAILIAAGKEYLLEEGTCFLIPPGVEHTAKVIGNETWVVIATYCDECPVLKKELGKEGVDYPISSGA